MIISGFANEFSIESAGSIGVIRIPGIRVICCEDFLTIFFPR